MSHVVDFENVSTAGLESSPVAEALAGLRANEARYFMNKYKHAFTVVPASESQDTLDYVNRILKEERDIEFAAKPWRRRASRWRASGWPTCSTRTAFRSTSCTRSTIPRSAPSASSSPRAWRCRAELEGKFKFARQKSKLAGTIRGSFFVIKGEY